MWFGGDSLTDRDGRPYDLGRMFFQGIAKRIFLTELHLQRKKYSPKCLYSVNSVWSSLLGSRIMLCRLTESAIMTGFFHVSVKL